jgi:membrane protein implicated in regulation of membrane protease activity
VANKRLLPADITKKVPPVILMWAQGRVFWVLFGFALCLAGPALFGGIVAAWIGGAAHLYIWSCLAGAVLAPTTAVLLLLWFPIQPYRDSWQAQVAGMKNKDKHDPEAKRLVDLFASTAARRFTLQAGLKVALLLFAAVSIDAALQWRRIDRSLSDSLKYFLFIYTLVLIGSFVVLKVEIVTWAFKNWENFRRGEGPFQLGS